MANMKLDVFQAMSYDEQKAALANYMVDASGNKASHSCGDGRKALNGSLFVKNFGGSLGAATVWFVSQWRGGNKQSYAEAIESATQALRTQFDLGGHRDEGSTASPTHSGCGYADNRQAIVARVATTENFHEVINSVFKDAITDDNRGLWDSILAAYQEIHKTQGKEGFTPTGEQLLSSLEAKDSSVLVLEGAHAEYAIVFNEKPSTTLDTNRLVDDGGSAFCVDIWEAMSQTDHLGINKEEAFLICAAEWVATALVLVVDKGNPLPPIFFYN